MNINDENDDWEIDAVMKGWEEVDAAMVSCMEVAQLHHLFVDLNRRLAQGAGSRMFLEIPKNPSGKQFTLHTRIVMTLFVKGS